MRVYKDFKNYWVEIIFLLKAINDFSGISQQI